MYLHVDYWLSDEDWNLISQRPSPNNSLFIKLANASEIHSLKLRCNALKLILTIQIIDTVWHLCVTQTTCGHIIAVSTETLPRQSSALLIYANKSMQPRQKLHTTKWKKNPFFYASDRKKYNNHCADYERCFGGFHLVDTLNGNKFNIGGKARVCMCQLLTVAMRKNNEH